MKNKKSKSTIISIVLYQFILLMIFAINILAINYLKSFLLGMIGAYILSLALLRVVLFKAVFKHPLKYKNSERLLFYIYNFILIIFNIACVFYVPKVIKIDYILLQTLFALLAILINFILYVYVIFKNSLTAKSIKKIIRNNKVLLIMTLFFVVYSIMFYCYPLTGDDWGKSSSSFIGAFKTSLMLWKTFNGRLLGNMLVILLKNSVIFKMFFESSVMCLLIYGIYKIIGTKKITTLLFINLLLLTMSIFMYRETISWMSGFANYLVPPLAMVIILYKLKGINNLKNKKYKWYDYTSVFVCGLLMNLFSEHTSIFSIAISIGLILLSLIQNRRIYKIHIILLFSTIIGCSLMFASPVYWSSMPRVENNEVFNSLSLCGKIINNLKTSYWIKYAFFDNVILNIGISLLFMFNIKNYKSIFTKIISILFFFTTLALTPLISFNKVTLTNKCLFIMGCISCIIVIYFICYIYKDKKNKLWNMLFYYLASFISVISLLAADSFGPRCFFTEFILQMVFSLLLYYDVIKNNKFFDTIIIILSLISSSIMFVAAILIYKTTLIREKIINHAVLFDMPYIYIPTYKYPLNLLIHQDGDAKGVGYHQDVFKQYYNIDESVEIYFTEKEQDFESDFTEVIIPSYDGSNQITHPSVLILDSEISGYKYWMAFTPWPKNKNEYENPSIVASNDGINWEVPDGLINPISGIPTKKYDYYSDPFLLYDNGTFELWYRFNPYNYHNRKSTVDNTIIYRKTSIDGINWSESKVIFDSEEGQMYMSISVVKEDNNYYVWYSNKYGYTVFRKSKDLINWTKPKYIDFVDYNDNVWHSEVRKVGRHYEMLFYSNVDNEIYLSKSNDCLNFTKPCLISTDSFRKDFRRVYKSSYIKVESKIYLYVPYEDRESNKPKWRLFFKKYDLTNFYSKCFYE